MKEAPHVRETNRSDLVELLVTLTITLLLIAPFFPPLIKVGIAETRLGQRRSMIFARSHHRFRHRETGVSIVVPDYWHLYTKSPALKIYARSGPIGTISVRAVSPPSAEERLRYRPMRHGDLPAYERMVISRVSTIEDPAQSRYEPRRDTSGWYEIEFMSENDPRSCPRAAPVLSIQCDSPTNPSPKSIVFFDVDLPSSPAR